MIQCYFVKVFVLVEGESFLLKKKSNLFFCYRFLKKCSIGLNCHIFEIRFFLLNKVLEFCLFLFECRRYLNFQ